MVIVRWRSWVAWFVDRSIDRSVGRSVDWFIWLVGWLVYWFTRFIYSVGWLVGWFVDRLVGWLLGQSHSWLIRLVAVLFYLLFGTLCCDVPAPSCHGRSAIMRNQVPCISTCQLLKCIHITTDESRQTMNHFGINPKTKSHKSCLKSLIIALKNRLREP